MTPSGAPMTSRPPAFSSPEFMGGRDQSNLLPSAGPASEARHAPSLFGAAATTQSQLYPLTVSRVGDQLFEQLV